MEFRTEFSHTGEAARKISEETGLACKDKSLAVQSEKDDADINILLKRFGITGQLPTNVRPILNVDFEEIFDFQEAQNLIAQANQSFMRMPAEVRSRFANDPAQFVDFCSDPRNLDEMVRLGIAERAPDPKTVVADVKPTTT